MFFLSERENLECSTWKACSLPKGNVCLAVPKTGEQKVSQNSEAKIKKRVCVSVHVYRRQRGERGGNLNLAYSHARNSPKFVRVVKES